MFFPQTAKFLSVKVSSFAFVVKVRVNYFRFFSWICLTIRGNKRRLNQLQAWHLPFPFAVCRLPFAVNVFSLFSHSIQTVTWTWKSSEFCCHFERERTWCETLKYFNLFLSIHNPFFGTRFLWSKFVLAIKRTIVFLNWNWITEIRRLNYIYGKVKARFFSYNHQNWSINYIILF